MPYRSGRSKEPTEAGRQEGLVDELIAQFADPLAFYRELVQNSIDAGATAVSVALAWEPSADGDGVLTASVRDDGCGMEQRVLEEELTVLFRSGKENDDTKIGKFGVGFISVLAVKPNLVAVQTSKGSGAQFTLHLYPDQTYDLFRAEGAPSHGTSVTLHIPMPRSAVEAFVAGSERALSTWCRHTELPIRFVALIAGADAPLREARIDRPFGLEALVAVDAEKDGTRVVAGLPLDAQPYLAFFNRGLLLFETRNNVFGVVAVKILDGRLEHTLSRDNVRRDEHHERAMRFARHVVETVLAEKVQATLAQLAERRRDAPQLDVLWMAAKNAGIEIASRDLRVPLLHPIADTKSISVHEIGRTESYAASEASAITAALANRGRAVVDLSVAASAGGYLSMLAELAGRPLLAADSAVTLATRVEASGEDAALLDALARVLGEVARAPESIALVELAGAMASLLYVAGVDAAPAILTHEEARRDPFRRLRRPPLWIRADAPIVVFARRAAADRPRLAAMLLARAILAVHGELDEARDDAWLTRAVALAEEGP